MEVELFKSNPNGSLKKLGQFKVEGSTLTTTLILAARQEFLLGDRWVFVSKLFELNGQIKYEIITLSDQ